MSKKNVIVWGAVLIFIVISVYVTSNYSISTADELQATDGTGQSAALVSNNVLLEPAARVPAIDFSLTDLGEKQVSLEEHRGNVVYINFWATWCKWCKKEMPAMERIYQSYKDQKLVILALDVGESLKKTSRYIDKYNYSFDVLLDYDKKTALEYGVKPLPVSIFVDKKGNIAYRKLGHMKEEEMKAIIDVLIKES